LLGHSSPVGPSFARRGKRPGAMISYRAGAGLGLAAVAGGAGWAYWANRKPPVVVVGGGVMGLNTAERLARAGRQVLLIDAEHPVRGSWGVTRASHFRMEDTTLLQMSIFSVKRWKELQEQFTAANKAKNVNVSDTVFYHRTGGMMAGPAQPLEKLASSVQRHLGDAPEGKLELLQPSEETSKRFPQVRLGEGEKMLYMPAGYTMVVPTCIECLKWAAARAGVKCLQESVVHIDRGGKVVTTDSGSKYQYADLVVTAGPWTNKVLNSADLPGVPLLVSNEQTVELIPKPGAPSYDWDSFPLFTWSEAGYKGRAEDGGCRYFYTTPHVPIESSGSSGVKIGFHRQGPLLQTDDFIVTDAGKAATDQLPHIRKELHSEQQYELDDFAWKSVQDFVKQKMPGLDADNYVGYMRCLYQCTPDLNMIVGHHPQDSSVVFACGFSGSGFQFAPAIADALAALVLRDEPSDMHKAMAAKFNPDRFACS